MDGGRAHRLFGCHGSWRGDAACEGRGRRQRARDRLRRCGLNIVQGAKLAGALEIIAVDLLDNKLEYAKKMGATHTINGKSEDVVRVVGAISGGAWTTPLTRSG